MAAGWIKVDVGWNLGADLINTKSSTENNYMRLKSLRDTMDQQIDGIDYSMMEQNFGIPTGKGEDVYGWVDATVTLLEDPAAQALFNQVGRT